MIQTSSNRSILHSGQSLLGALFLTLFLISCGGGGGNTTPPTNGTPSTDKMTRTLTFTGIPAGGEITRNVNDDPFTITAAGSTGTGAITYTSSNPAVATVDSATGEVTILTVGTTTITATRAADDRYNEATASYTLTVQMLTPPVIPATQSATALHSASLTEAIVIENTGAPLAEDGCQFVDAADSSTTTTNTAGLSIAVSGANCHITGTPQRSSQATAGTPEVVMLFIRAFNAAGSDWTTLTLTINPPPPDLGNLADSFELTLDTPIPTITFVNASDGIIGSNGCNIDPALPAGLTLAPTANNQSCRITGTPTRTLATTTYTITASDGITPDPTPAQLTLAVRLPAMQIQAGDEHSCLLNPTGEIWCWGDNTNGQLGTGDILARERPTRVGAETDWRSLAAGDNHNCATNASNQLFCWGLGSSGRLGIVNSDNQPPARQTTPTRVGMNTDWHSVSAGEEHTCGIRDDGDEQTLWCWGNGGSGRLGGGDSSSRNTPTLVMGGYTDWLSVGAGDEHSCGIRDDGDEQTLWCWGNGGSGRLGTVGTSIRNTPTLVMGGYTDWHSVSVGGLHTCGIRDDGGSQTLWCWGSGSSGQLGTGGNPSTQNTPDQAGVEQTETQTGTQTNWHSVSAGDFHTCGIRDDGAERILYCWGSSRLGRLGTGDSGNQNSPKVVGSQTDWRSVSASRVHTCGIREDDADRTLWCWGVGGTGQLGTGGNVNQVTPIQVSENTEWRSVSAGGSHTCGIRAEGADQTLWCWGSGGLGRLGILGSDSQPPIRQTTPTQVDKDGDANWNSVSTGESHTCGIRAEGANQSLWCWGFGSEGRLGTGSNIGKNIPTQVDEDGDEDWHSVSLGRSHTCGIRHEIKVSGTEQNLYCWGANSVRQLGTGGSSPSTQNTPTLVMGGYTDWRSVSAGEFHTCGIREDGASQTLWCWGSRDDGLLGTDSTQENDVPGQVGENTDWQSVSSGSDHTCGIRRESTGQTLWCWGRGTSGQLGIVDPETNQPPASQNTPAPVMGGYTDWQSVSAGEFHTCGVRGEGAGQTLWCWGSGTKGQLGTGSFTTRLIPRPVPSLTTPSLVDLGYEHTCAISSVGSNNSLFCWGDVSESRLGIGEVANFATSPQQTLFAIESLVTPTALGDALDTGAVAFNLLGARSWVTQTEQTNDNTDAAAITTAAENELACITASTSGAGSLSFYWRVSSDRDSDFLKFYLDAVENQSISGMVDWVKVDIPDVLADTELRWCYEKDDNDMTTGEDGAFLDQVVFTPR